jgi:hypothetical protein
MVCEVEWSSSPYPVVPANRCNATNLRSIPLERGGQGLSVPTGGRPRLAAPDAISEAAVRPKTGL